MSEDQPNPNLRAASLCVLATLICMLGTAISPVDGSLAVIWWAGGVVIGAVVAQVLWDLGLKR